MTYGYGYGYPYDNRRKKAWTPAALGSALVGWWDASDAASITLDGSNRVSQWSDKSGNARHMGNATAGNRPVLGTGINSKQTINFAGANALNVASIPLGAFTIYVVFKTAINNRILVEHSANVGTSGNGFYLYTGTGTSALVGRSSVFSSCDAAAAWCTDNTGLVARFGHNGTHASRVLQRDGSNVSLGAPTFSSNPGTATVTDTLYVGARNPAVLAFVGDIGEIVLLNEAPNATTDALIMPYFRQVSRWGTP